MQTAWLFGLLIFSFSFTSALKNLNFQDLWMDAKFFFNDMHQNSTNQIVVSLPDSGI